MICSISAVNLSDDSLKILRSYLNKFSFPALIGISYAVESCKSLLLILAVMAKKLEVSDAVKYALLEQQFQTEIWGKVN